MRHERDELRFHPVQLAKLLVGPGEVCVGRLQLGGRLAEMLGPLLHDDLQVAVHVTQRLVGDLIGRHEPYDPAQGEPDGDGAHHGEDDELAQEVRRDRLVLRQVLGPLDEQGDGRKGQR